MRLAILFFAFFSLSYQTTIWFIKIDHYRTWEHCRLFRQFFERLSKWLLLWQEAFQKYFITAIQCLFNAHFCLFQHHNEISWNSFSFRKWWHFYLIRITFSFYHRFLKKVTNACRVGYFDDWDKTDRLIGLMLCMQIISLENTQAWYWYFCSLS